MSSIEWAIFTGQPLCVPGTLAQAATLAHQTCQEHQQVWELRQTVREVSPWREHQKPRVPSRTARSASTTR